MGPKEEEVVGDDLDGFFSEISKVTDGPKAKDEEKKKTLSMTYAEMDLGKFCFGVSVLLPLEEMLDATSSTLFLKDLSK